MATEAAKKSTDRAARREYQVLQGITHRGIVEAVEIREHQGGPAILFRHKHTDLRLDQYLATYGGKLTPEIRLDLVRQLAEAVRYAHNRALYHRALAASSVYVSFRSDGTRPELRITDWQTAARDFDSNATFFRSIGGSALDAALIEDAARLYLAPETDQPYADPADLDMFGLGAVAYLILTGQPPATQRSALSERLRTDSGLHLYAVADGFSDALDELVFKATRSDVNERLGSAEEFLDLLDRAERASVLPEAPTAIGVDALEALPGQSLDTEWSVRRVLGTGATARALLVERAVEDEDGHIQIDEWVFKVALDEQKAERLRAEAGVLKEVGGGAIVQLRGEGLREIGGRTVLQLEYAGEQSLGARLRGKGKLTYHELERFGDDLFRALDQLAANGVLHRDLKPDNFGIHHSKDRIWRLKLFDFSLADASERDIKAGTRGYMDPFLGSMRRPYYDDHAERYAAAVTLHEMAGGERPMWGDGQVDPLTNESAELYVASELFESALNDGLTSFFRRALHRDTEHRFDTLRQMHDEWREVFRAADATKPATTPATVGTQAEDAEEARDAAAEAADAETLLEAAGLSPRAVSVAHGLGATKVGELLNVQPYAISKARGAGALVRKELNRRRKQWAVALRQPAGADARPAVSAAHTDGDSDPDGPLVLSIERHGRPAHPRPRAQGFPPCARGPAHARPAGGGGRAVAVGPLAGPGPHRRPPQDQAAAGLPPPPHRDQAVGRGGLAGAGARRARRDRDGGRAGHDRTRGRRRAARQARRGRRHARAHARAGAGRRTGRHRGRVVGRRGRGTARAAPGRAPARRHRTDRGGVAARDRRPQPRVNWPTIRPSWGRRRSVWRARSRCRDGPRWSATCVP
ncbi:protein kinase domain-containing protein [Streptomyces sp. GTA36]